MKFKNAQTLQAEGASVDQVAQEGKRVFAAMDLLMTGAEREGRNLTADEQRQYDALEAIYEGIADLAELQKVERPAGLVEPARDATPYRNGAPLAAGQSFAGFVRAQGHDLPRDLDTDGEPLSLTKFLRGAFTGDWRDAEAERIMAAQSGASAGAGGVMIPTVLTADLIDLARNKTRVLEAGARTVPMASRTVDVPRWLSDPDPSWRAENAAIAEDDATMDKITLSAKSLAVVTKVSRELVEDTNIDNELRDAFAKSFAQKLDLAALYADGTNGAPTGVKATAAVTKTAIATNGAAPTWATLVNSVGRLRDVNEDPTAQIMSDRTLRTLSLLEATDGSYVAPPSYLDGVPRYSTGQVPNNLDEGTSVGVASDLFTADWGQLLIGVRTQLVVTLLSERYMPDAGQYGFVAWWRGDFAVARAKAFDVVTGITS